MSNKLLKIFLVIALILVFHVTYVSASDVNLNLPGTDANQVVDNPVNNENVANTDTNQNNINNQGDLNETNNNDLAGVENLQPTMVSSSQSGLSVSNIINILLITVGVILILLAIAIMIRLK